MVQVKFVFFSPTGTTKAVLNGIEQGIKPDTTEWIDITVPEARKKPLQTSEDELLVIGVPVYMGRVPALITEWLHAMRLQNTLVVCVVVYGNRTFEDALLELRNIVLQCGGIPVAGGAYIGEHSFSSSQTPTAAGRPNADDLEHAKEFGRKIRGKLESVSSGTVVSDLQVPGEYPYRGDPKLWVVDFIAIDDSCTSCGHCAEICPTGAIDSENSANIEKDKCITCCACIKNCPENARTMKPGPVQDASVRLHTLYAEQKMPEYYL
ncbi:MAG: 4Fe-4S binding protein [Methanomicrobiales archaeon]|nr:4Fe-4S binding protein [Methanomicrobiales archaeon]